MCLTWYRGDIVVGWCRTRISPSNSQQDWGSGILCERSTIPLRMSDRRTCFFKANDAVWPACTWVTGIRLRWIDLICTGLNRPSKSGPSKSVSFSLTTPFKVVPLTTVPTPGTLKRNRKADNQRSYYVRLFSRRYHTSNIMTTPRWRYVPVRIIYLELAGLVV